MDAIKAERKSRKERLARILADPDLMDIICCHVANGGSLIGLAETFDVRFGDLSNFANKTPENRKRYNQAVMDRTEWSVERILSELRLIGLTDLKDAYDDKGNLKPMNEMPEGIRRAIAGVDVTEEFVTVDGKPEHVGSTKKLKMIDKIAALKLLGQNVKMFVERHDVSGVVSLADLVLGSMKPDEGDSSGNSQPAETK